MELSKQVVSLGLARKLKELGVKQESLFYWVDLNFGGARGSLKPHPMYYGEQRPWDEEDLYNEHWIASAFTVAELGEMLPDRITQDGADFNLVIIKAPAFPWLGVYETVTIDGEREWLKATDVECESEAELHAKILIYLVEQKLVTL
jgi:hypothetical protein